MRRHILAGLALAVLAAAIVLFSGPDLQGVTLLGAALGGALGLVPDRSPGARAGAFAVGFLAAWLGYALRAAALPDSAAGRAVAVLVVLAICLAVAGATRGRLPLWAALLGTAAMAGAYEATYAADPSAFVASSAATATSILLAAGAGFVATSLLGVVVEQDRAQERADAPADGSSPAPAVTTAAEPVGGYEAAGTHAPARPYASPDPARRGAPATRPFDPQPEA
ncbi:hypothetical protein GXP71_16245 [Cellulomonas sp. H30R-01]|uniref:hypothetical protein n=1 Tax=Cellulomonas sp. H30R-01 TaxID=2704467 RepID=UPI00138C9C32|nr:hypothetical protein [Cellulomonas sp. H30R-01]QHT57467.1 hypothetical protein GXP71_16245 [Cellulomonas sp. H30R-01]